MDGNASEPSRGDVRLRDVTKEDVPTFFEQQLDEEANRMAAFTTGDPSNRAAFATRWERLLGAETVLNKTILVDGRIAGHVASFGQDGEREVTYWLGREYWGMGVATAALREFLRHEPTRPLVASAAKDNVGSIRVLEKCGFEVCGENRDFASARGEEVEELILKLAVGDGGR